MEHQGYRCFMLLVLGHPLQNFGWTSLSDVLRLCLGTFATKAKILPDIWHVTFSKPIMMIRSWIAYVFTTLRADHLPALCQPTAFPCKSQRRQAFKSAWALHLLSSTGWQDNYYNRRSRYLGQVLRRLNKFISSIAGQLKGCNHRDQTFIEL